MRIDLSFSATHLDEMQLREKNVVVIDVLRASTTITAALANGAREIIPVATIENAVKVSGSLFGDVTLRGGERNGKMIQGFNLGNSPLEYTEAMVRGKSVIYCTTNGTVALVRARHARNLVVGSFVNMSRVVEFVAQVAGDFFILCAGRAPSLGGFSLEDAVCAGMLIDRLSKEVTEVIDLTDSAQAALSLFKTYGRSLGRVLRNSEHGKYLMQIGFAEDLKICAAVDSIPVLPVWTGTSIRLRREDGVRGGAESTAPEKPAV
jgi:2-phosphosulfolactate phosphatase